jgi:hypothetical protein
MVAHLGWPQVEVYTISRRKEVGRLHNAQNQIILHINIKWCEGILCNTCQTKIPLGHNEFWSEV